MRVSGNFTNRQKEKLRNQRKLAKEQDNIEKTLTRLQQYHEANKNPMAQNNFRINLKPVPVRKKYKAQEKSMFQQKYQLNHQLGVQKQKVNKKISIGQKKYQAFEQIGVINKEQILNDLKTLKKLMKIILSQKISEEDETNEKMVFNQKKSNKHQIIDQKYKTENISSNKLYMFVRSLLLLFLNSPNYCLNLNMAAENLNVQKRRVYKIIISLHSVGYVQKAGKNTARLIHKGLIAEHEEKRLKRFNQLIGTNKVSQKRISQIKKRKPTVCIQPPQKRQSIFFRSQGGNSTSKISTQSLQASRNNFLFLPRVNQTGNSGISDQDQINDL